MKNIYKKIELIKLEGMNKKHEALYWFDVDGEKYSVRQNYKIDLDDEQFEYHTLLDNNGIVIKNMNAHQLKVKEALQIYIGRNFFY